MIVSATLRAVNQSTSAIPLLRVLGVRRQVAQAALWVMRPVMPANGRTASLTPEKEEDLGKTMFATNGVMWPMVHYHYVF
jgi:hypothetical protein